MDHYFKDKKSEYGSEGGSLNMMKMIQSRAMEMIKIDAECQTKLAKQYHQRLPRFMRRRAASHNVKRIPKRYRPSINFKQASKTKSKTPKIHRKFRMRKHKRILRKHDRHKYKDPSKSLLHKWFAKRFKMQNSTHYENLPLHNNTKNYRNLYRAIRNTRCFIAMLHMSAIKISLEHPDSLVDLDIHLEKLNTLTTPASGFTFCARSLMTCKYEVCIHFFNSRDAETSKASYVCPGWVKLRQSKDKSKSTLVIWLTRDKIAEVTQLIEAALSSSGLGFSVKSMAPKSWSRVRVVGPKAQKEALRLYENKKLIKTAVDEASAKLYRSLALNIGRVVDCETSTVTIFNSKPSVIDIVFKKVGGRMLWYKLVRNNAHLVGGYRDYTNLMQDFVGLNPKPDHLEE